MQKNINFFFQQDVELYSTFMHPRIVASAFMIASFVWWCSGVWIAIGTFLVICSGCALVVIKSESQFISPRMQGILIMMPWNAAAMEIYEMALHRTGNGIQLRDVRKMAEVHIKTSEEGGKKYLSMGSTVLGKNLLERYGNP